MSLITELDKRASKEYLLRTLEDNQRLMRVPLDELQIIEALFPLVKANFQKSWANIASWEHQTLAKTTIDEWDYSILLTRDDKDYSLRIDVPSRGAFFYKPHYGNLHDDKVADLIDEVEAIVSETILAKQKKIMHPLPEPNTFTPLIGKIIEAVRKEDIEYSLQITQKDHSVFFEISPTKIVLKLYFEGEEIKAYKQEFEDRNIFDTFRFLFQLQDSLRENKYPRKIKPKD